ncbi:MAG: hypothetical protein HRU32_13765 [Rhodobacteraceae bacterium]|nr:hypothetical protein [Paracoccaceae bacterium]
MDACRAFELSSRIRNLPRGAMVDGELAAHRAAMIALRDRVTAHLDG